MLLKTQEPNSEVWKHFYDKILSLCFLFLLFEEVTHTQSIFLMGEQDAQQVCSINKKGFPVCLPDPRALSMEAADAPKVSSLRN